MSGPGDVRVQKEKEIGPPPRSSIGEPKKTLYKFPHILFPYRSRYKSPNRHQWWPGATARFPGHTHPKRWIARKDLSISFFAYHAVKPIVQRNLYELLHTVPMRGVTCFFWRDGHSDAWKNEGRKCHKTKARGVRTPETFDRRLKKPYEELDIHESGGKCDRPQSASGDKFDRAVQEDADYVDSRTSFSLVRKQLVFSPNEVFFKYRPFKAVVLGRLAVGSVAVDGSKYMANSSSAAASGDEITDPNKSDSTTTNETEDRMRTVLKTKSLISCRLRVAPPQPKLGGWQWQPPNDANHWIFRPKFPDLHVEF